MAKWSLPSPVHANCANVGGIKQCICLFCFLFCQCALLQYNTIVFLGLHLRFYLLWHCLRLVVWNSLSKIVKKIWLRWFSEYSKAFGFFFFSFSFSFQKSLSLTQKKSWSHLFFSFFSVDSGWDETLHSVTQHVLLWTDVCFS